MRRGPLHEGWTLRNRQRLTVQDFPDDHLWREDHGPQRDGGAGRNECSAASVSPSDGLDERHGQKHDILPSHERREPSERAHRRDAADRRASRTLSQNVKNNADVSIDAACE